MNEIVVHTLIRDGKKLDEIDLTRFSGKAYVLDAEGKDIHSLELPLTTVSDKP
jgi:kynurenine formamidase